MRRPIRFAVVATFLAASIGAVVSVTSAAGPGRDQPVDLERVADPRLTLPPGMPTPLPPESGNLPAEVVTDEPQLVGFTIERLTANRGVLHMTLACQRNFAGSRICTVDEVARTVFIPEPPAEGFAWVQVTGSKAAWLANGAATSVTDCQGWTSNSSDDHALTVNLGCGQCYGGFVVATCNEYHEIACCAPIAKSALISSTGR